MKTINDLVWRWQRFDELTSVQLYEVLRLRQQVFVVEQMSIYLDLDNLDDQAQHLCVRQGGDQLAAYCRVFPPGVKYSESSIGRVVVAQEYRKLGLGEKLMEEAIRYCFERYSNASIKIAAQVYLERFYRSFSFQIVSDQYDEDGIPHQDMRLDYSE